MKAITPNANTHYNKMSHTATTLLNYLLPNITAAILLAIPVQDANQALLYAGYIAKTLTFLGAMTVNFFAIRHYYLQNKRKKK